MADGVAQIDPFTSKRRGEKVQIGGDAKEEKAEPASFLPEPNQAHTNEESVAVPALAQHDAMPMRNPPQG